MIRDSGIAWRLEDITEEFEAQRIAHKSSMPLEVV